MKNQVKFLCVCVFVFLSLCTDENFLCLTKHEPVGVCGAIIPVSPQGDLFVLLSNNLFLSNLLLFMSVFGKNNFPNSEKLKTMW